MAFKRTAIPPGPTRIYSYGITKLHGNTAFFDDQFSQAARHRNALTAIERERRAKFRALHAEHPLCRDAALAVTAIEKEWDDYHKLSKAEKRKVNCEAMQKRGKAVRAAFNVAKAAARKADPALVAAIAALDAEAKAQIKTAVKEANKNNLGWGTKQLVDAEAQAARSSPFDPRFGSGREKVFIDQETMRHIGRVGIQIQKGMTVAQLFACTDSRLRIKPVSALAQGAARGERIRMSRTEGWLRIGSVDKDGNVRAMTRTPLWVHFDVTLHRPLPPDGKIMRAWIVRTRLDQRWRYALQIGVESALHGVSHPCGKGIVALDVGWRRLSDGQMRVAYAHDGERSWEIRVPASVEPRLDKVSDINSERDRRFDACRDRLVAGIAELTAAPPEWFALQTKTLAQWRSSQRLARLVRHWMDHRWPGDVKLFDDACAWRKHERFLYKWQECSGTAARAHRKHAYAEIAAALTMRYAKIVIEDFDLRQFAQPKKAPADEVSQQQAYQRARGTAAASILRNVIKAAAPRRGAEVVEVSRAGTTDTCHVCGDRQKVKAPILHTCTKCGTIWDRDENAAINLWRRGETAKPKPKRTRRGAIGQGPAIAA